MWVVISIDKNTCPLPLDIIGEQMYWAYGNISPSLHMAQLENNHIGSMWYLSVSPQIPLQKDNEWCIIDYNIPCFTWTNWIMCSLHEQHVKKRFPSTITMTDVFNVAFKLNEVGTQKVYLDEIVSVSIQFSDKPDMTEIFEKVNDQSLLISVNCCLSCIIQNSQQINSWH